MEPRFSIITLGVSDLARSTAFYRDGLKLPYRTEPATDEISFFTTDSVWLALYSRRDLALDANMPDEADSAQPTLHGFSIAHNVDSRAEVDAVLREAEAAGARIQKPAEDTFWGGYSGYFADPDGFLWEVATGANLDTQ